MHCDPWGQMRGVSVTLGCVLNLLLPQLPLLLPQLPLLLPQLPLLLLVLLAEDLVLELEEFDLNLLDISLNLQLLFLLSNFASVDQVDDVVLLGLELL